MCLKIYLNLLLCYFLLNSSKAAVDYKEKVKEYCDGFNFSAHGTDGATRIKQRKDNALKIGLTYDKIVEFRSGDDNSALFKGTESVFIIFSIIALLACLIYVIIFLSSLCCCK